MSSSPVVSKSATGQCNEYIFSFSRFQLEETFGNAWVADLEVMSNAMAADIIRKSWHAVLRFTPLFADQ